MAASKMSADRLGIVGVEVVSGHASRADEDSGDPFGSLIDMGFRVDLAVGDRLGNITGARMRRGREPDPRRRRRWPCRTLSGSSLRSLINRARVVVGASTDLHPATSRFSNRRSLRVPAWLRPVVSTGGSVQHPRVHSCQGRAGTARPATLHPFGDGTHGRRPDALCLPTTPRRRRAGARASTRSGGKGHGRECSGRSWSRSAISGPSSRSRFADPVKRIEAAKRETAEHSGSTSTTVVGRAGPTVRTAADRNRSPAAARSPGPEIDVFALERWANPGSDRRTLGRSGRARRSRRPAPSRSSTWRTAWSTRAVMAATDSPPRAPCVQIIQSGSSSAWICLRVSPS